MGYDEGLAERIRALVEQADDVSEKKMFGGLTFLVEGKMAFGINGEELMVRVGPGDYEAALRRPHAREMDFTGRALKGFVYVACEGFESDGDLSDWVARGMSHARSLPAKRK